MYQHFKPQRLPGIGRQVHRLRHPDLVVSTLMEDGLGDTIRVSLTEGLQNVTIRVGDVSVLPVKVDKIGATSPVPEA